jgi:hypothetical protein
VLLVSKALQPLRPWTTLRQICVIRVHGLLRIDRSDGRRVSLQKPCVHCGSEAMRRMRGVSCDNLDQDEVCQKNLVDISLAQGALDWPHARHWRGSCDNKSDSVEPIFRLGMHHDERTSGQSGKLAGRTRSADPSSTTHRSYGHAVHRFRYHPNEPPSLTCPTHRPYTRTIYAPPSLLAYSSSILSSYSLSFSFCCSSLTSVIRPALLPLVLPSAMRRPLLSISYRSSRGAWPGSWLVWCTRVPELSLYVDCVRDVVCPLTELETEEKVWDW